MTRPVLPDEKEDCRTSSATPSVQSSRQLQCPAQPGVWSDVSPGTLYKVPTHNVSHPVAKNVNYVNHFSGRHVPPLAYIDIILENYKLRSSAV